MLQQLKLATGDENIRRRVVRSAAEEAEQTTASLSDLEISEATTVLAAAEEEDVTTEWSPAR